MNSDQLVDRIVSLLTEEVDRAERRMNSAEQEARQATPHRGEYLFGRASGLNDGREAMRFVLGRIEDARAGAAAVEARRARIGTVE